MPDLIDTVLREFYRYPGDGLPDEPEGQPLPIGDPQSGPHSPTKADIRHLLRTIYDSSGIAAAHLTPAIFGALGHYDFATRTGPDDTLALRNAMNFASANGIPLYLTTYHKFVGQYDVPTNGLTLIGCGRENCGIMFQMSGTQSGLCTINDNLVVRDLHLQSFMTGPKAADSGHLGLALRVGDFFSGEVLHVTDFEFRGLKISRAVTIGSSLSYSSGGLAIFNDAHHGLVEDIVFEGTMSTALQCHWSNDANNVGDTITATGHPHDITFRNIHFTVGTQIAIALSACYNITIDHVFGENCEKGVYFLPGDETGDFAPERDRICRNIVMRNLCFINCVASDDQDFIDIFTVGTSRFRTEGGLPLKRTIGIGLIIDGLYIETADSYATGIRIFSGEVTGSIEIREARIKGFTELVRLTRSICDLHIDLCHADGLVFAQNSDNYRISGVVERPESLIDDSSGAYGSCCIQMIGGTEATTLSGSTSAGATTITLAGGLAWDILPGDFLYVDNELTTATRHVEAGLLTVPCRKLVQAHSNGDQVYLDMRGRNTNIDATTIGARTGIYASGVAFNLDGPGPQRAGRFGIFMNGTARLFGAGLEIRGTGRARTVNPSYTCYDIVLDPNSRAVLTGGTFGEEMENINGVFKINGSGTDHGIARLFGCRVLAGHTDNVDGAMFFSGSTGYYVNFGCFDTVGNAW